MISKTFSFVTDRLLVKQWHSLTADDWAEQDLPMTVSAMLTPAVTQSLPVRLQSELTQGRAKQWIEERDREGATLLIVERASRSPIGLMILFESDDEEFRRTMRLGYLLSESSWGRGLASELVKGFVVWCRSVAIGSIVGGVEQDNVASQRVLEKNGFVRQQTMGGSELFFQLQL